MSSCTLHQCYAGKHGHGYVEFNYGTHISVMPIIVNAPSVGTSYYTLAQDQHPDAPIDRTPKGY